MRIDPSVLIHYTWLGLMLVQLAFSSWLGTRFGARAVMRVLVPLSFFAYYFEWIAKSQERGPLLSVGEVQVATSLSLLSFLTLFSFAFPYFFLLKVLAPRMGRGTGTLATALGATVSALALRFGYMEGVALLDGLPPATRHAIAAGIAITLMVGAHRLFRSGRADDRAPAACSPWNLLVRLLTLGSALLLLDSPSLIRSSPVAYALAWVLSGLPRQTLELVAGTQSANGPRSAEAVLAGLPVGLIPYVVFCLTFAQLVAWTDQLWTAYWLAFVLSLVSIVPLLVTVIRDPD